MDRKTPLIIITGPTGSGKTQIAFDLVNKFPIEVISADSMQVYRHMDIATAKPGPDERALLPHHIIDVVNPDEEFNAGMFASLARQKISEIYSNSKIPVVVGGTGLYIKALTHGLVEAPPGSEAIRTALHSIIDKKGSSYLWNALNRLDATSAQSIGVHDKGRIIRYLEIIFLTGTKPSTLYQSHGFSHAVFDAHIVCVMPEREMLYTNINNRVLGMMKTGLIEETENLLTLGYDPSLRSMQTLAYKHIVSYLNSDIKLQEALSNIQRDTRHFAKRQITWFNSNYETSSFCSAELALTITSRLLDEIRNTVR